MSAREEQLLPFTKLVLVVSAAVQFIFGIVGLFFVDALNEVFWRPPLPPWPPEVAHYAFLNYLATGIAAVYALRQGSWAGAKVYFAFAFSYIAMGLVVNVLTAIDPGVPTIMWGYIALSVIYLPVVVVAWRRQNLADREVRS